MLADASWMPLDLAMFSTTTNNNSQEIPTPKKIKYALPGAYTIPHGSTYNTDIIRLLICA
jgi:hypothetical protein